MNIKISANNSISKNKITIELKRMEFFHSKSNLTISFRRERDQYERRVVELDRQITQNELQIQNQTKEKENLLIQVNFQIFIFLLKSIL